MSLEDSHVSTADSNLYSDTCHSHIPTRRRYTRPLKQVCHQLMHSTRVLLFGQAAVFRMSADLHQQGTEAV